MSEFSESYHLWTDTIDDGKDLLNRSRLNGFIFPEHNNWVTILPEGDIFILKKKLIEANQGILLHYIYAADHGWSFGIYKKSDLECFYECEWDRYPNITIKDKKLKLEVFRNIIDVKRFASLEKHIKLVFYPESNDDLIVDEDCNSTAYKFSNLIGLKHYQWLSHAYVYSDSLENPNELKDRGCELYEKHS